MGDITGYITLDTSITGYVFDTSIYGVTEQFIINGVPISYMIDYINSSLGLCVLKAGDTMAGRLVINSSLYVSNEIVAKRIIPTDDGLLNTFYGISADSSITTGVRNTAIGYIALQNNRTGMWNTAIGARTLSYSETASYNNALGVGALFYNTTGHNNTAIGIQPLYYNQTGYRNTAVGNGSLFTNSNGYANTAMGYGALNQNSSGNENTAYGYYTIEPLNSGSYNTALGSRAGSYIYNGATANASSGFNVFLGAYTKALANGDTNEIVIGYNTTGGGSNSVTIGNTSIQNTYLRGTIWIDGSINLSNRKITGLLTPTDSSDAVNKWYVDNLSSGVSQSYVDGSLAQRDASITDLYSKTGGTGVSQAYVDGSLAMRDSSIIDLYSKITEETQGWNGLTKTEGSIGLGGALSESTIIDIGANGISIVSNPNNTGLEISPGAESMQLYAADYATGMYGTILGLSTEGFSSTFTIDGAQSIITQLADSISYTISSNPVLVIDSSGIKYNDDYSYLWGERSLVDKAYADNYNNIQDTSIEWLNTNKVNNSELNSYSTLSYTDGSLNNRVRGTIKITVSDVSDLNPQIGDLWFY